MTASRPPFRPLLSRRFDLYSLDLLCRRYPGAGTPSQAIGAHDTLTRRGFSPASVRRACFAFDVALAHFGEAIDKRREETVLKDAPKNRDKTPKVPVPKYRSLEALLNINTEPVTPAPSSPVAGIDDPLAAWNADPEAFLSGIVGEIG